VIVKGGRDERDVVEDAHSPCGEQDHVMWLYTMEESIGSIYL
jgi:hypothetical protein